MSFVILFVALCLVVFLVARSYRSPYPEIKKFEKMQAGLKIPDCRQ